MLAHTTEIRRLLFRSAKRVPVDLSAQFHVVRQEVAAERTHNRFKAHESQFAVSGRLQDISIGGAMARLEPGTQHPQDGDFLVFRLPQAQIKEDLVAQVLHSVAGEEEGARVHVKFVGLSELNRLKLTKFLHDQEAGAPAPAATDETPSAAPSS